MPIPHEFASTDFRTSVPVLPATPPARWLPALKEFETRQQSVDGVAHLSAAVKATLDVPSEVLNLRAVPEDALEVLLPVSVLDALRPQVRTLLLPPGLRGGTIEAWLGRFPHLRELDAPQPLVIPRQPLNLLRAGGALNRVSCEGLHPDAVLHTGSTTVEGLHPGYAFTLPRRPQDRTLETLDEGAEVADGDEASLVGSQVRGAGLPPPPPTRHRTGNPPSHSLTPSDEAWRGGAELFERLMDGGVKDEPQTLGAVDLQRLQAALGAPASSWAPPASQDLRLRWQARIERVFQLSSDRSPTLTLTNAELMSLLDLLQDLLAAGCVIDPDDGSWRAKTEEELVHTAALSGWMKAPAGPEGAVDADVRSHVGHLLLQQQAGMCRELYLMDPLPAGTLPGREDDGSVRLELPPVELLSELMHPMTRVHLTVTADVGRSIGHWGEALQALPLRSWHLSSTGGLEPLMREQRTSVRHIDLTDAGEPLSAEDLQVLRQALHHLPNLVELRLPSDTPSDALGPDWVAKRCPIGCEFTHASRPDGLKALDDAVAAWHGNFLGTRMAVRRKACDPDAQFLLVFAQRLAEVSDRDPAVGCQVRDLLKRCATDDASLKARAQAVRAGWLAGEPLVSLLARVANDVGETAAAAAQASRPHAGATGPAAVGDPHGDDGGESWV